MYVCMYVYQLAMLMNERKAVAQSAKYQAFVNRFEKDRKDQSAYNARMDRMLADAVRDSCFRAVYVCMYACMYICMCDGVCSHSLRVYVCVCMCVCVCECVCVRVFVFLHRLLMHECMFFCACEVVGSWVSFASQSQMLSYTGMRLVFATIRSFVVPSLFCCDPGGRTTGQGGSRGCRA